MKIENLDLNLLKVFYYVYTTRSVNRAAQQLNISQSACSHSLARLRERLDDELFIRVNQNMVATQNAERLAQSVLPAMSLLQDGLQTSVSFNPDVGEHQFVICATDFITWVVMPTLTTYLANHYPNIKIRVIQGEHRIPSQQLESGEIDLALGFDHDIEQSNSIDNAVYYRGPYCIAMDENHPILRNQQTLDLDHYLSYSHVLVTPWNESQGIVDRTLAKLNKKRRVAIALPSVLSAPYLLKGTEYFLALPLIYAQSLGDKCALRYLSPPMPIPDFQIKLYWHKLKATEPKLNWLIQLLLSFHTPDSQPEK
ncbi:LysR family transcriptional regulator [Vibrio sp. AK197]